MAKAYRIPPTAALAELLGRDPAAGVDVFDHGEAPRSPGPADRSEPLLPALIPPPDWRQEEQEQAQRQAGDEPEQLEPEASLSPTPAKPKRRDGPKPTP